MAPRAAWAKALLVLVALGLCIWLACLSAAPGLRPGPAPLAHPVLAEGCAMSVEVLHHDPLVRVVHGFATPEEARAVIDGYAALLKPSTVVKDQDHAENVLHASRTSYSAFLPAGSAAEHPVIWKLEQRAVLLTGKRLKDMETLQLVRYQGPGQFYRPHFDYFHDDPASQRTVTIFVYLNDTGGEGPTEFPRLGLKVQPACGKACIWENCHAAGRSLECDPRLEHAGASLRTPEAVKYGVNVWFRSQPFR